MRFVREAGNNTDIIETRAFDPQQIANIQISTEGTYTTCAFGWWSIFGSFHNKIDFWYSNRYCDDLSPYKLGGWVVCRRSFNSTRGLTPLLVYVPRSSDFFLHEFRNRTFKKGTWGVFNFIIIKYFSITVAFSKQYWLHFLICPCFYFAHYWRRNVTLCYMIYINYRNTYS